MLTHTDCQCSQWYCNLSSLAEVPSSVCVPTVRTAEQESAKAERSESPYTVDHLDSIPSDSLLNLPFLEGPVESLQLQSLLPVSLFCGTFETLGFDDKSLDQQKVVSSSDIELSVPAGSKRKSPTTSDEEEDTDKTTVASCLEPKKQCLVRDFSFLDEDQQADDIPENLSPPQKKRLIRNLKEKKRSQHIIRLVEELQGALPEDFRGSNMDKISVLSAAIDHMDDLEAKKQRLANENKRLLKGLADAKEKKKTTSSALSSGPTHPVRVADFQSPNLVARSCSKVMTDDQGQLVLQQSGTESNATGQRTGFFNPVELPEAVVGVNGIVKECNQLFAEHVDHLDTGFVRKPLSQGNDISIFEMIHQRDMFRIYESMCNMIFQPPSISGGAETSTYDDEIEICRGNRRMVSTGRRTAAEFSCYCLIDRHILTDVIFPLIYSEFTLKPSETVRDRSTDSSASCIANLKPKSLREQTSANRKREINYEHTSFWLHIAAHWSKLSFRDVPSTSHAYTNW